MTTEEIVERLAAHKTIGSAPRGELIWIATHGTHLVFKPGDVLTRTGQSVDGLYIVLSGKAGFWMNRGNRLRKVFDWGEGDVTGLLPYSRMKTAPGDAIVEETMEAIALTRADLPAMIRNCTEATGAMVHAMTDRARRFTSTDLRDEKLVSLGKLAAGLAHELNNPASAAQRDAKSLGRVLTAAEEAARALGAVGLTEAQRSELNALYDECMKGAGAIPNTGLALADREEEFADWLDEHGVQTACAEDLAKSPVTIEKLNRLAGIVGIDALRIAIQWIAAAYASRSLAVGIERAAKRIHDLVSAVKGFTHMDKELDLGPVDIATGLAETVALMQGKAKAKSVAVNVDIPKDLPQVQGLSAEINQIWMNLIDNAIDAAPESGHVTVSASNEDPAVVVRVADDGHGIPPDIMGSIFDPFFTTKSVGEGTGLGLDIVRRIIEWHNGDIKVSSEPGHTEFRVSLPAHA
jgi:signal transduction histidine kinase